MKGEIVNKMIKTCETQTPIIEQKRKEYLHDHK